MGGDREFAGRGCLVSCCFPVPSSFTFSLCIQIGKRTQPGFGINIGKERGVLQSAKDPENKRDQSFCPKNVCGQRLFCSKAPSKTTLPNKLKKTSMHFLHFIPSEFEFFCKIVKSGSSTMEQRMTNFVDFGG